jgi:hypothetical protein
VGFDEGAQAVKYYNAKTCNILTSQNFRHINPPEPIELTPNMAHEGESEGDTLPMGVAGSDDTTHNLEPKRKQKRNEVEGNVDINELQKTHGICTNYKLLHDPFPEEEEEETFLTMEEVYAIIASDELTSLKEAKNSTEWPEWERAMEEQLDLLKEMGTWETVPKPPDAVPIANKWVFVKKQDKGNFFASCQDGHSTCNFGSHTNERAQDATDGCQGHIPEWHFAGDYLHATT